MIFKTNMSKTRFLCLGIALLSVSGCGMKWPEWATIERDPFSLSKEDKNLAPSPPNMVADKPVPKGVDPEMIRQQMKMAEATPEVDDPFDQPFSLSPYGSMGSLGLNLGRILEYKEDESVQERLARLEAVIQAMHRDLKILAPAVRKLNNQPTQYAQQPSIRVIDDEMDDELFEDDLIEEGEAVGAPVNLNNLPQTEVVVQRPAKMAAAAQAQNQVSKGAVSEASASGDPVITGVRVGQHPDMVRIVFDSTKKTSYSADLDNTENLLVVEMPDARWDLPFTSETFGKQPVVKSYSVASFNSGKGQIFVLQLKQNTEIIKAQKLPALSGGGQRIVIDLKK